MRLIDADEEAKWVSEHILDAKERYGMLNFLRNCSTVDAIQVVRCKDCGYFGLNDENVPYCSNPFGLNDPEPNGFCNYKREKMWTKFKHWLIRKLGGYVAPCIKCNEYKRTLIEITRPVEMIRSQYCVNTIGHIDPQVSIELAKAHIFNDLMEGIKDRNCIKYEYEDDGILRGTLMVVKPV